MTEMTSVGMDAEIKECKICDPFAKSQCRLASTTCPYRDIDTLIEL
jgi:hypothetical protein